VLPAHFKSPHAERERSAMSATLKQSNSPDARGAHSLRRFVRRLSG
jgi:hypothetical protein